MMSKRLSLLALCVLVIGFSSGAQAEETGTIGLALSIDADGIFAPTLNSVTVTNVVALSPAAGAGILVNDRIIEVEGHAIVGSKARDLQPYLNKIVGQSLHLRLKRPNGEEYAVTLVAVARPKQP